MRRLLFQAVLILVAKNQEYRQLHLYYTNRIENPLKKKQYFYSHQNIYSKVEDGKIKFYYQNSELAFTPKYTINPNVDYVKVDHNILEEYMRSILDLSSHECYIENSFENLSVKDLYSYNWNGEAYEYKVPELILVIHGEKLTIPFRRDYFCFDQNGNMYFRKYDIYH